MDNTSPEKNIPTKNTNDNSFTNNTTPLTSITSLLEPLEYNIDHYKCLHINLSIEKNYNYFTKHPNFAESIFNDFIHKYKYLKAAWLTIPIKYSNLIPQFYSAGFNFHHTDGNDLYMTCWINNDKTPNLPKYASHYIGVGGIIFNSSGDILLVKERRSIKQLEDMWKTPTGLIEKGESIENGLLREIKEETGLDVKYEGVFGVRETHPYLFGCSDLFIVCVCKINDDSQEINFTDELKACKWFKISDVKKLVSDKRVSPFSEILFNNVFDVKDKSGMSSSGSNGLPILKPNVPLDVNYLKKKFIFHSPQF